MRCPIETPENAETLLAYCSRKLDPASAAVLEQHMQVCPACREFAAGQRTLWEALDSWEAEPVSPDFDQRLYERIEKEISWLDMLMRPFRPLMFRHVLSLVGTACLVIVAAVMLQRPPESPAPPPNTAELKSALEEVEMLQEFHRVVPPESAEPRM